jgi:GNAT superfamily N-acetyltransferase
VSTNNVVRNNPETPARNEADRALLSEGRLRPFEPNDIVRIASLYNKIFEGGDGKPSNRLCGYFEELFFKNPWADPLVPSWLYENNKGDIKAFAAAHPRRMVFDGEPIMCAAVGYWMVAEDYRGRGLGSLMAHQLAERGPVLLYGDTAGRPAISTWKKRPGGATVPVAGIQWEYVLKNSRLDDATNAGPKVMRLPSRIVNEMRLRRRRAWIEQQVEGARISEVAPDVLERLPDMLRSGTRLYPQYDAEYVSWLIKVASELFSRGELRHSTVLNQKGDGIDGWYFLWVAENARAEVLQIVSKQGAEDRVLAQLIGHAGREGAASVAGQWCGHDTLVAAQNRGCHIGYVRSRTLIHSRNTEIMRAIMCGDYFLSRFEGESLLDLSNT